MTAQASDVVIFGQRNFSLAGVSGDGLFDPMANGFRPKSTVSFCWRGYICTYAFDAERLLLRDLRVFFDSRDLASKPQSWKGVEPRFGEKQIFADYIGLNRLLPFTGGLLLGHGLIDELYVHMGFHPAWKFREVHELVIHAGQLQNAKDCSYAAEEFRKTITTDALRPADMARIDKWIKQTFSLRYERG